MDIEKMENRVVTAINLDEDYGDLDKSLDLMKLLVQHTNYISTRQNLVFCDFKYDKEQKQITIIFWDEVESKHILEGYVNGY